MPSKSTCYHNARFFNGDCWVEDMRLMVNSESGEIFGPGDVFDIEEWVDCENRMLVPAYMDLQVYGAGGLFFAEHPTQEALQLLAETNLENGTHASLVTIPSQPLERILECLGAVADFIEGGGKGIFGMHLEGPFINSAKRGAHYKDWLHKPQTAEVEKILDAARGHLKLVTLAPEICSNQVLERFMDAGVILSAGHSNASYREARLFSERGISMGTHLFNAMTEMHHRDPGLPGALLQNQMMYASCIPDGIHVNWEMLKIAKKLMEKRLFFITDGVTQSETGAYRHMLQDHRYVLPDGTLSGSALTMPQAVKNGIAHMNLLPGEAIRMASLYPARVMGLGDTYGKLKPGYVARMILLDDDYNVVKKFGF